VSDREEGTVESVELDAYCRAIESHLCRKNDGHLIRIAGPAFDLVRGWADQGIPLKVAIAGIDRTFERYYRRGPRRRPVHVSFCDADVLDGFDDWRRAMGLTGAVRWGSGGPATDVDSPSPGQPAGGRRRASLPQHLDRVANRLTLLRGDPRNHAELETALERAVLEVDSYRQAARQARGAARASIVARLAALDEELLATAHARLHGDVLQTLTREAAEALVPFRERMPEDAYRGALEAALARLVREHAKLPLIRYDAED
jgi:hypothetical protein